MGSFKNPHHLANPSAQVKDGNNVIIKPNGLNIVWGGDSRYWNMPEDDNMDKPVELHQVCWLEVTTCVEKTNPTKPYEVGFRISFGPDAFGWGTDYPIYFMTKRGKSEDDGAASWKKIVLDVKNGNNYYKERIITRRVDPVQRRTHHQSDDDIIHFGLYEVWSGKWKGGLRIHSAFLEELK